MRFPDCRKLVPFAALLFAIASAVAIPAHAATTRPNVVDIRVDRLSTGELLSRPATALVDARRQVAARVLERVMFPAWLVAIVAQILALAYFWRSGNAARLRDWLRRRGSKESWVRMQFGAALALIAYLAALIPDFYIYRVTRSMGLSDQLLRGWSLDWIVNLVTTMIATACVVAIVLWLVERTHQWYLYTIAIIFVVSYGLVFFKPFLASPLLDRFAPLPAGASTLAQSVERRANIDVPVLVQFRSRSALGMAYVEGMGPTERIVLGHTVLAVSSPAELRFVIARELGDIESGAPFRVAFLNALCVIFGAAVAVAVADRIGFRRDDDPTARLALVAALLGVVYLIVLPINNAALRRIAAQSDSYAVSLTGERAPAIRVMVRSADQSLRAVCPTLPTRLFLERVSDPSQRIAAINGVPSACP